MRIACSLVAVLVSALAAPAHAGDPKLDNLVRLYSKELTACRQDIAGLAKIGERGKATAATDAEVAAHLETLAKAQATVQGYCDEVSGALDFIKADPKAKYKKLEKELDRRDNAIRAGRKQAKKVLAETSPLIGVVITKCAAQQTREPTPTKAAPGKFPSGRTVELPALAGTWKVSGSVTSDIAEYKDDKASVSASVIVRGFSAATCDQQRKALAGKATLADIDASDAVKAYKPAFYVQHKAEGREVRNACIATKGGGVIVTVDAPIAHKLPLEAVMVKMIAARKL